MTNNTPDYDNNLFFTDEYCASGDCLAEENKELKDEIRFLNEVKFKPFSKRLLEEKLSENKKLKELLKECFEYIDWTDGTGSPINQQKLLDKIDEVLK